MRKLMSVVLMVVGTLICGVVSAQDVITLKTGEDLNVKVLKVGSAEIEYKKSDNPDGPSYTVQKSDVFMIKYQNGSKDVFNTTTAPATNSVATEPKIDESVRVQAQQTYDANMKKFRRKLTAGIVCTAIGVPCLATGTAFIVVSQTAKSVDADIYNTTTDYDAMGIAGGGLLLAGTALTITGPILIGKSFKYRRLAKEAKAQLSLVPSITPANAIAGMQTGLAMRLTF